MPKFPTPSKKAEIADRQRKVAALLLNRVHSAEIARNLGVDPATITRDVRAIKAEWGKETLQDISCHISRELAELDRMELEASVMYQKFKGDSNTPTDSDRANKWLETRLKIKDRRIKLLGLDQPSRIDLKAEHSGEVSINFIVKDLGEDV